MNPSITTKVFRFVVLAALVAVASAGTLGPIRKIGSSPIVGGTEASIQDAPWQVALHYNGTFYCGGSIISPTVILTAAHCIVDFPIVGEWDVQAGSNQRFGGTSYKVSKMSTHPQHKSIDYDIAVLILTEAIAIDDLNTKTIPLPALNQDVPAGSDALVTGWGATHEGGHGTDTLRKVILPVVDQVACANAYKGKTITDRMICGGKLGEGGVDACQGDSGGPFVVNGVLVGVTSFGYGCAKPSYPGVWTRVPALVDWVQDQL